MVKYHTITDREYRYNTRSNIKCIRELTSEINKKVEENACIKRSLVDTINKCKRMNSSYCFVHKNYTEIYNSYNKLIQDFTSLKETNFNLTEENNTLKNSLQDVINKYNNLLGNYDELLEDYIKTETEINQFKEKKNNYIE